MPAKVTARRSYPAGHEQRQAVGLLAQRYPDTVVKIEGDADRRRRPDRGFGDGRPQHRRLLAGRPTKPPAAGKQVYKLSAEHALDDLLPQLSERLDVEFQLDRPAIQRAGISLDQIVTVNVEGVSLDQLLAAVLEPAGLKGVRRGRIVTVTPKAPAAAKP